MKTIMLAAGAATALAWAAPASTQAAATAVQPSAAAPAKPAMTRAMLAQKVQKRFTRLDANRDGFVTRAEAQAIVGKRLHRRSAGTRQRTSVRRDPTERFGRFDSNRDGQIARAEAEAVRAALAARGARAVALFERADANRDGTVSRAEFDAVRAQGRKRVTLGDGVRAHMLGGRMFAMADADKDGRVGLQEATVAALRHFDSADTNRDGTVSRDERRQMRRRQR